MKIFIVCLGISVLFSFCNNSDPSTKGVSGDSIAPSIDGLSKQSSNKHIPSDTTNTKLLSKNWNNEFVCYDLPLNTREIIWLKAGARHLQDRKMAGLAQKASAHYEALNKTLSNYLAVHRDFQPPEIDTLNTVDIVRHYGTQWDRAWIKKAISTQDSLVVMVKKSLPSITDSSLLQVIDKELPQIQSDLTQLKRFE